MGQKVTRYDDGSRLDASGNCDLDEAQRRAERRRIAMELAPSMDWDAPDMRSDSAVDGVIDAATLASTQRADAASQMAQAIKSTCGIRHDESGESPLRDATLKRLEIYR